MYSCLHHRISPGRPFTANTPRSDLTPMRVFFIYLASAIRLDAAKPFLRDNGIIGVKIRDAVPKVTSLNYWLAMLNAVTPNEPQNCIRSQLE